jgi:DNA-binding transcriptional regulator YiaG
MLAKKEIGTFSQITFLRFYDKKMQNIDFINFRKKLEKTQMQMAHLMGLSLKAIKSYEQGWRAIPSYVEREILFLVSKKFEILKQKKSCWTVNKCPAHIKSVCPAWEFKLGTLCWLVNGSICNGTKHKRWTQKIKDCRNCDAFPVVLKSLGQPQDAQEFDALSRPHQTGAQGAGR